MSTKGSRKNVPKQTNAITTRNKTAQQSRQLRAKNKKTEKPVTSPKQTNTKTITKSPKVTNSVTCCKDTPLKTKVRTLAMMVEQAEYYPDKLKRALCNKKIMLKPKDNFKVIATANKRKLSIPQKGGFKSPPPLKKVRSQSPKSPVHRTEMSMADMVRLIEDNHTLSDEDFMEILTCPSPVWWEDPPDDGYVEDAICSRPADPTSTCNSPNTSRKEEQDVKKTSRPEDQEVKQTSRPEAQDVKKTSGPEDQDVEKTNRPEIQDLKKTSKPKNQGAKNESKTKSKTKQTDSVIDVENEIEGFKISPSKNKSEKFNIKKQKLENILGSIKNCKKVSPAKSDTADSRRKVSTSTDGEEFSDLSFNEEEVLKNLENMEIPIEKTKKQIENTDTKDDEKTEIKKPVNQYILPDILPPLTRKPDFKVVEQIKCESSDSYSDIYLDSVSQAKLRFISDDDDDVGVVESSSNENCMGTSIDNKSSPTIDIDSTETNAKECINKPEQMDNNMADNNENNKAFFRKKSAKDLSEYITVYKIVSQDEKSTNNNENVNKSPENSSNNNMQGKLNSFFKKRKNNKRSKISDSSVPAIQVTDVKNEKENSDSTSAGKEENRLKPCDFCVEKTESGTINFSCDKCVSAPTFSCDMCNFFAITKETFANHSCKELPRISWNNNLITNQT